MEKANNRVKGKEENTINKIYYSYLGNLRSIHWYFQKFGDLAIDEDENIIIDQLKMIKNAFKDSGIDINGS